MDKSNNNSTLNKMKLSIKLKEAETKDISDFYDLEHSVSSQLILNKYKTV